MAGTRLWTLLLLRILIAAVLGATAAVTILWLRVGPVVLTISSGHGVHTGDSIGLAAAVAAMWILAPREGWVDGTRLAGLPGTPSTL